MLVSLLVTAAFRHQQQLFCNWSLSPVCPNPDWYQFDQGGTVAHGCSCVPLALRQKHLHFFYWQKTSFHFQKWFCTRTLVLRALLSIWCIAHSSMNYLLGDCLPLFSLIIFCSVANRYLVISLQIHKYKLLFKVSWQWSVSYCLWLQHSGIVCCLGASKTSHISCFFNLSKLNVNSRIPFMLIPFYLKN